MTALPIQIDGQPFFVRLMEEADRNYIFVKWLESARPLAHKLSDRSAWQLRKDVWEEHYPQWVESRLDADRTVVLYRESAPEVIHGWACGRPSNVLHWAHVPAALRGLGAGKAVISMALGAYSSRIYVTSPFERMVDHPRYLHNPLITHVERDHQASKL